jgi:hypothetical protein
VLRPEVFASFGAADENAYIGSLWLSRSPLLSPREQKLYALIAQQEKDHATVSDGWAAKLGWKPEDGLTGHGWATERDRELIQLLPEPHRTAHTLATLAVIEDQAVRGFRRLAKRLPSEMAVDYKIIAKDEEMHLKANALPGARLRGDRGARLPAG